jgi:hypothetical protein
MWETDMAQKMIFMGDGEHSIAQCQKVHDRLKEGFSHLSGSQQWSPPGKFGSPSGSTKEEWTEGQNEISNEILAVVEDIALALGAKVHRTDDERRFVLEVKMKRV